MIPVPRRMMLGLAPWAAACNRQQPYLGKTTPPHSQRLIYEINGEPDTLDPGKSNAAAESYIIPSLFEALVFPHPRTSQPLAGLATHYQVNDGQTEFLFYLRGHPHPRGVSLPDASSLRSEFLTGASPDDFSRGLPPADPRIPARWSDGVTISAHDFVFSWRRNIQPESASPFAAFLHYLKHAKEISAGRRPAEDLGVHAVDDYTLRVELHTPIPFFLNLQENFAYYAVPMHVVAAADREHRQWTSPGRIVTGGAFTVQTWQPYDHLTLVPNPFYYDAHQVALKELVLLPVVDGTTNINLYKAGLADSMLGKLVAPSFIPLLREKKDFETAPAYWCMFYTINTTKPPFDNPLVRYALNMSIDKNAIARFLGAGQTPAAGLLPPLAGYPSPKSLTVAVDGSSCDILAFNPEFARQLLRKAGIHKTRIDILYPSLPASRDLPLILQQQWHDHLGIEVALHATEETVCHQYRNELNYIGVAERGWWGDYLDPNTFLEAFLTGPSVIGAGWSDPVFDEMLRRANSVRGVERMIQLALCEQHLLRALPVLPLYYNVQAVLKKPYVRGLPPAKVDSVRFKYAWIDTNWRPQ